MRVVVVDALPLVESLNFGIYNAKPIMNALASCECLSVCVCVCVCVCPTLLEYRGATREYFFTVRSGTGTFVPPSLATGLKSRISS